MLRRSSKYQCYSICFEPTETLTEQTKKIKKISKSFLIFQNYLKSSDGVLIIHRVTNTTVGMYRCIATNDAGSSQANINLKVTYGNEF